MHFNFRIFSRNRPRVLTIVLLIVIATLLVLANLSDEIHPRHPASQSPSLRFDVGEGDEEAPSSFLNVSYGWPLLWRQHVVELDWLTAKVLGECYSPGRLIGNSLLWLVMMAAPAAACERLLRRYRPRLRWSLRAMFAAVGIGALFLGWIAMVRNRADAQDALVVALEKMRAGSDAWVEYYGPKWLDVVGAERYRRYVKAVEFHDRGDAREADVVFKHLRQLPSVRYFFCEIRQLNPSMVNSLRGMRGLRVLSINAGEPSICDENEPIWRNCFAAIAEMPYLEQLHLDAGQSTIDRGNLVHLAGLANLRRLSLNSVRTDDESLLAQLRALPKLETVDLSNSAVGDEDLPFLARLPKLKSLNLADTAVTHLGLPDLAAVPSLEELRISSDAVTPAGLDSLRAVKRLNKLHIEGISWRRELGDRAQLTPLALDGRSAVGVAKRDLDAYRNALESLRRSKPGIVIDRDELDTRWAADDMVPLGYDNMCYGLDLHRVIREWHEQQGAN